MYVFNPLVAFPCLLLEACLDPLQEFLFPGQHLPNEFPVIAFVALFEFGRIKPVEATLQMAKIRLGWALGLARVALPYDAEALPLESLVPPLAIKAATLPPHPSPFLLLPNWFVVGHCWSIERDFKFQGRSRVSCASHDDCATGVPRTRRVNVNTTLYCIPRE